MRNTRASVGGRGCSLTHALDMASSPRDDEALLALRRSWKFASVCQFLFTFDEVLQLDGFQTQVGPATLTLATGIGASTQSDELYFMALQSPAAVFNTVQDHYVRVRTNVRQDNWAEAFRLQWSIRAMPAVQPLLGTEEEPVAWESLDILEKVGSISNSSWRACLNFVNGSSRNPSVCVDLSSRRKRRSVGYVRILTRSASTQQDGTEKAIHTGSLTTTVCGSSVSPQTLGPSRLRKSARRPRRPRSRPLARVLQVDALCD